MAQEQTTLLKCPWCGKLIRIRKDGCYSKHRMEVGYGYTRGTDVCPRSGRAALAKATPSEEDV